MTKLKEQHEETVSKIPSYANDNLEKPDNKRRFVQTVAAVLTFIQVTGFFWIVLCVGSVPSSSDAFGR